MVMLLQVHVRRLLQAQVAYKYFNDIGHGKTQQSFLMHVLSRAGRYMIIELLVYLLGNFLTRAFRAISKLCRCRRSLKMRFI